MAYCSVLSEVDGIEGTPSSSGKTWGYELDRPYVFEPEPDTRSRPHSRYTRYGRPPERPPGVPADWVKAATYEYAHRDGWTLFQVERWTSPDGEKTFRPIMSGASHYGLPDWARRPYRLPQLLSGIKAGLPVYVVEGEKDVDSGYAHTDEAVFTCCPCGARSWLPEFGYARWFDGAGLVVVVADRDENGRHHAREVREDLASAVQAIQIVQAHVGSDLTDHLEAGLTLADLEPIKP